MVQAVLSDRNVIQPAKEESLSLSAAQWNNIFFIIACPSCPANCNNCCFIGAKFLSFMCSSSHYRLSMTDTPLLKAFKTKVLDAISKRFIMALECDSISAISSALDPRDKSLKFLPSLLRSSLQDHVRHLVNQVEVGDPSEPLQVEQPAVKKPAVIFLLGADYYDEEHQFRDEYSHFLEEPPPPPYTQTLIH